MILLEKIIILLQLLSMTHAPFYYDVSLSPNGACSSKMVNHPLAQQVLHLQTTAARSDGDLTDMGISKSMPALDLGLTVISKLLADHTFLPPHSSTAVSGVDFPVPEGEALQKPVCDAICGLVDHAVSAEAVQKCLYLSAESVTGTDDEEEPDDSDGCNLGGAGGEEEGGAKGCDRRGTTSRSSDVSDANYREDGNGNCAGDAVSEMETAPESEDERDRVG